jgi:hypothetical protein
MMGSNQRPNIRGHEVVRLLATHDALSFFALQALLRPAISARRLREVLGRLTKSRMVRRRLFRMTEGSAAYYEIAEPARSELGIQPVHSSLLSHNDSCSFVASLLSEEFPGARLFREHSIPRDEELRVAMQYETKTHDSLPDILIELPTPHKSRKVLIAVEIERSNKSTTRTLKKLTKYAYRTRLDGVFYVSEDQAVLDAINARYRQSTHAESIRIGHYRDNFLITGRCPTRHRLAFTDVSNSAGKPVSLTEWIRTLTSTEKDDRRDFAF